MSLVPLASKETLLSLIQEWMHPGTVIHIGSLTRSCESFEKLCGPFLQYPNPGHCVFVTTSWGILGLVQTRLITLTISHLYPHLR